MVTPTDNGSSNASIQHVVTLNGLKFMQYCLSDEYDEEVEFVYMKHKGPAPKDWYRMAVLKTQ
jgi:hypothetical protein